MNSVDNKDIYQAAVEYYTSGKINEAENLLKEISEKDPGDFDVLNFLGIIELEAENYSSAIEYFLKVVAIHYHHPGAHYNLALCYQHLDRIEEAEKHYHVSLSLDKNNCDTLNNLGLIAASKHNFSTAEKYYLMAAGLNPSNTAVLNNLANLNLILNKYREAAELYKKVIRLQPEKADYHYNLGNCCLKLKNYDAAIEAYIVSLKLNPQLTDAYNNLGIIYTNMQQYDKAVECYEKILAYNSSDEEAYLNLGICYQAGNNFEKAVEIYQKAAQRKGSNGIFSMDKIMEKHKDSETGKPYERIFKDNLNRAVTFTNIGIAKLQQGLIIDSLQFFNAALELNNDLPELHYNKSHALLLNGEFDEGWKEYEWRLKRKEFVKRIFSKPRLKEESPAGKKILVYDEQGLGDSIQFVRYLKILKESGAYTVFECDPRLEELYKNAEGIDLLIKRENFNEPEVTYDYHIPLLSLPFYFKTTLNSIPADTPYLFPDKNHSKKIEEIFKGEERLKIGIIWGGNPNHAADKRRSVPLKEFFPLFETPGVKIFSLQLGEAAAQLKEFSSFITDLSPFADTIPRTAAVIENLDLIITVDTSLAHLAGSLGKEVWVLLPYLPDWRWLLNRDDSPWYPSAKLFRQEAPGNWKSVFDKVRIALEKRGAGVNNHLSLIPGEQSEIPDNCLAGSEPLYLGLSSGDNFGWGVCSKYLTQELSALIPVINLGEQQEIINSGKAEGKVFHALTDNNFESLFRVRGKENTAYTFFENELNENSRKNSSEYDLILAGSSWCSEKMKEAGISNCDVLIQGIDPEVFYPGENEKENNLFVVFSGGKFEYRKGQDIVLGAFRILQQKYPDIILVNAWYNLWPQALSSMYNSKCISFDIKGKTWDEFMLNLYRINGLDEKRIFTLPLVPNYKLRELYLKTDVGIFPNRCEGGTNLVLMEYMACGKPVIASYNSGHRDILTEQNSLMLECTNEVKLFSGKDLTADWSEPDIEQVVEKIEYAYNNREKVKETGKEAAGYLQKYTWENTAKKLLGLLNINY